MSSLYRLATYGNRGRLALERIVTPTAVIVNRSTHQQSPPELKGNLSLSRPTAPVQVSQCNYGTKTFVKKKKKTKKDSSSSSSGSSSDSDSDKGKKASAAASKVPRGQTSFWRQKMRTHHMAIDVNKDGIVSWDDFEMLIKNFSTLGNLAPKEIEMFTDAMKHVWEEEWGGVDDPYAFMAPEDFLSQMERALNTKYLRKKIAGPLPYFFKAVDWDNSGEISVEEYRTFFKCLGLSEEAANEAFNAIDLNGDGRLSQKEFVRLGRNFFLSEDEADPSKLFWGPLCK